MAETRQGLHSGGCQCGAIRYALYAEPYGTHICHCRMCQKAFGAGYAPLTLIRTDDFSWTRGSPSLFRSSPDVARGFCSSCGTPLTYQHNGVDYLNIAVGSLDHPDIVTPEVQIGIESRLPWVAKVPNLPEQGTDAALSAERISRVKSYQHPDHDTKNWPESD
ncbi:MAG: GFA family protein [Kiloniellales bacterium]|nr:GFA family protein [Kiloniellales bacterium]